MVRSYQLGTVLISETTQHAHPDYVMSAASSFKRRLTFADGRTREVDVKTGDVLYLNAHVHIGENIGTTDTDVIQAVA